VAPTIVRSFDGRTAEASVRNSSPVLYLHATDAASLYPDFDPEKIKLLRLKVKGDHRELPVSVGVVSFRFAPDLPKRMIVAISVKRLSQTLMELQPRDSLPAGQYLITIGVQNRDGFEFEVACGD
jgi:hypothetical protein